MSKADMDIMNMSDEELMKLGPSAFMASSEEENQEKKDQDQEEEVGADQDESEGSGDEGAEDPNDEGEDQADEEDEDVNEEDSDEKEDTDPHSGKVESASEGKAEKSKESKEKGEVKAEGSKEPVGTDYESEYKKLLAPFVANGREMSVKSVDEAITLMQMGANYNKKMAALKPSLGLLKLLESNGLADAEKISYLIDLANKDAGAVNKLSKTVVLILWIFPLIRQTSTFLRNVASTRRNLNWMRFWKKSKTHPHTSEPLKLLAKSGTFKAGRSLRILPNC